MASLRDIRRRIQSVKNTRQITRAMKLVAGAKLKRATDAAVAARPYAKTLRATIDRVVKAAGEFQHPLLAQPDNTSDVIVVVLTSDRGLAGSFNANLLRQTDERIAALRAEGKNVQLVLFGRKGVNHYTKRGATILQQTINVPPEKYAETADALAVQLVQWMQENRFERVVLAYNAFLSVMNQKPTFDKVLPMEITADEAGEAADYIFEPAGPEILGQLLPLSLRTRLFQAFLETQAGEQAARMTAMDNATRNASELIDGLTLEYNRARQAAITTELTEIVSGAEAL